MTKTTQETGRSMVEMLGVLAVIGVLSVGGIAAYKNAMNKHEANSIRNEVNRRVVVWASDNAFGRGYSSFNENALGYQWQAPEYEDKDDFIQFGVSGIEAEICEKVKSNDWKMVYVNENCTTFAFKNDLTRSEIQPTCGPCGVANPITGACNDDDSKCGTGETCYNGYCSTCEDGEFKSKSGKCVSCNDLAVYAESSADECHRCAGKTYYSIDELQRCESCLSAERTSETECLTNCSNNFYASFYGSNTRCYYCDPEYGKLRRENRLGRDACLQTSECPDKYVWLAGKCRSCESDSLTGFLGVDYAHFQRCIGIYNSYSKSYLFYDDNRLHLDNKRFFACSGTADIASTQEGCLVCNQPDSQHRRYFDSANETCVYCPSGETAPDGTPCDDLTTQSTTAGIVSTP